MKRQERMLRYALTFKVGFMQAYRLKEGVHYCVADGAATFLDVDADRYFGLPASSQEAFAHLVAHGTVLDAQVAALAPLTANHLLVATETSDSFPRPIAIPAVRESALDSVAIRSSLLLFFRAWYRQAEAGRDLGGKPLSRVLAKLSDKKARTAGGKGRPPDDVVAAFLTTSIVSQSHDQCLRRSIAMVQFLTDFAYSPLFVIGVRNNPFEAHAWVQDEDMALNDEVEKIGRFTPILAI